MKSFLTTISRLFKITSLVLVGILLTLLLEAVTLLPFTWFPIPIFIVKVGIAIFVITHFYKYLAVQFRENPHLTVFLCVVCISLMVILFYPPTTGKDGFAYTRSNPHEYSEKHWYFLNRINPVSPFDHTGMAYISKKDNLTLPPGYITRQPITKDGWYSIRTRRFLVISVVYGTIMGFLATNICAYLLSKYIKNNSATHKNRSLSTL